MKIIEISAGVVSTKTVHSPYMVEFIEELFYNSKPMLKAKGKCSCKVALGFVDYVGAD